MHSSTIFENELVDNIRNKAVEKITLVQTNQTKRKGGETSFLIYVELSWKEGKILLVTQKKQPRSWTSLDRLVRHINAKYGVPVPDISLHLLGRNQDDQQSKR